MKIEEHIKMVKLFDVYGKLLSQRQFEVFDKFLNLDIGESEIAKMSGESRQSIYDAINKAKKQLITFEEKCGIVKQNETLALKLNQIKEKLEENDIQSSLIMIENLINNE